MAGTSVNNAGRSIYISVAGSDGLVTGRLAIQGFIWSGATTKDHTLTFTDASGQIIFGPIIAGGLGLASDVCRPIIIMFPKFVSVDGLICSVMESGTVTVFLA